MILQKSLLEKKILSVIAKGDILFIVPPFVTTKTPVLGPHLLQSIAQQLGHKTDILQLNLLLASIIGLDQYESVSYGQPFRMLGERFFSRSAFGLPPLGNSPEFCTAPHRSVFGNNGENRLEEFEYKYSDAPDFELDTCFVIEGICTSFIEEVVQIIASLNYRIIGCSTNWEQNNCCIALLNGIKRTCPDKITIIGGSNCEGQMAEGIGSLTDKIDYIFSGESETSFADFLERYSAGDLPSQRIIVGEPLKDMDSITLPDYSSYIKQRKCFLEEDSPGDWTIGYETSRGCWWGKCFFCGMNGVDRVNFRQKSVKKTLGDLDEMRRDYPGRGVAMVDKVMPVSYQKELLPILGEEKNLPLTGYEQRADISLGTLIQMKKANILYIKPGIETLAPGLLNLMNKGISAWQNIFLLRNAAALGIKVDWNLLWGFPGEKADYYEEILDLLPLLHHCHPPRVFRHICIDRFSPYFEKPDRFHIKNLRPWAVYDMVYPDWAEVKKLAYRFIGDYPCAANDKPGLIRKVAAAVTSWKTHWQQSTLTMLPLLNYYMIYDRRNINEKSQNHVVTYERAREIMTCRVYNESDNLKWAVEHKLGVILESRYVPLVTASPGLLLKFEAGNTEGPFND